MPYSDETRIILKKMLEILSEESSLEPGFQEGLERLVQQEKLGEEGAITLLLNDLAKEAEG